MVRRGLLDRPGRWRSVRRQRRVDLLDPGDDAALYVYRVAESGGLDRGERLGRPYARLAVQHDLPILRQSCQRLAGEDVALRDEYAARNAHDVVLGRLTYVDQQEVLAGVLPLLQLRRGDRRAGGGRGGLLRHRAAEVLV